MNRIKSEYTGRRVRSIALLYNLFMKEHKLKLSRLIIISFMVFLTQLSNASPRVASEGNGIYLTVFGPGSFGYLVDISSQLCFAQQDHTGWNGKPTRALTQVPCENVVKRDEWKEIITWINE